MTVAELKEKLAHVPDHYDVVLDARLLDSDDVYDADTPARNRSRRHFQVLMAAVEGVRYGSAGSEGSGFVLTIGCQR